ncbi:MAG TPA: DEAD/DEAH box helicase [Chloroflexota bacterium]|nr:DEAD/DEAH box helicase [Chloroflexota bacterium]
MTQIAPITYGTFLHEKRIISVPVGIDVPLEQISPLLFEWQREVVQWALKRGRAALFEDCGLGKSPQQLEWARLIAIHTQRPVLILAPLAVAPQTAREGQKFGIPVTVCRSQADVRDGVNVTNYEMLAHFDSSAFGGIVLDESSILKSYEGSTRKQITDFARAIAFRLACTATPAPNDLIELTNHAEFLDVMSGKEIVALFFTQDGNSTHDWRLKGHAKADFWRWLASWSVAVRSPSDLGHSNDGYVLPELHMHQITVDGGLMRRGDQLSLLPMDAVGLADVRTAQRESLTERVKACAELVNGNQESWIVWCHLNAEGDALRAAIPGAVEVRGSDTPAHKERAVLDFIDGRTRVLISKPSIFGFGLNLQHCARVAFVGLSYSYEQFYQAIRRCWRFGQVQEVECYVVVAESEGLVVQSIRQKEAQAREMMAEIVAHMRGLQLERSARDEMDYRPITPMQLPAWMQTRLENAA